MYELRRQQDGWVILLDNDGTVGPFPSWHGANEKKEVILDATNAFFGPGRTDLDHAAIIKRLIDSGLTQMQIADVVDRQQTWVSFINKLNGLPNSLLKYLRDGIVKTTTLVKAKDTVGIDQAEEIIRDIVAEKRRANRRPIRVSAREILERAAPARRSESVVDGLDEARQYG